MLALPAGPAAGRAPVGVRVVRCVPSAAGCCDGRARRGVPSALPSSLEFVLPAEDGRLWPGGKRAGWNRGHDLATGAPLNRAARDGEIRRRLAAGESVRSVARALRCGLATVQRARLAG